MFRLGNMLVRVPSQPLQAGEEVSLHCHNFHHITYFPLGVWECWQFDPIMDADGKQLYQDGDRSKPLLHMVGHSIRTGQTFDGAMPLLIPKNRLHKFKVLEGPAMYHCIFPCLDPLTHETVPDYNGWHTAAE